MQMLSGSLVAIVTPMLADGALDLPRLKSLIDWHIADCCEVNSLRSCAIGRPVASTRQSWASGASAGAQSR